MAEKIKPHFVVKEERVDALKNLFPEAVGDGDINWDLLKESLGEFVEDDSQEHFGLNWPGKREARKMAFLPPKGTLKLAKGEGINEDSTENLYIEGDNLEVLKLLQKSYYGKVKMIYIDPPYNTGNDFIYSDDFTDTISDYLEKTGQLGEHGEALSTNPNTSGRFHSNWLNMMYPRLILAKNLLKEDGVVFISIDDNEMSNLRLIMDEIFGSNNFIASTIWQKVFSPKNSAKHFSVDHDYILVYAKNSSVWTPNLLERTEEQNSLYKNPDDDPRGVWMSSDLTARNYYGDGQYIVEGPTGKSFSPNRGSYWRISKEKFQNFDQDGRIWWGKDKGNMPRLKRFLSEVQNGRVPQTLWTYKEVGHTQDAKRELLKYIDFENTENVFNSVKPQKLLKQILHIGSSDSSSDIVMDFFSGSGTLGQAVLQENVNKSGNRKFILIQLPEPLKVKEKDLATIADLAKSRLRNVCKEIFDGNENRKDKKEFGFKVLNLSDSNIMKWSENQATSLQQLEMLLDNSLSSVKENTESYDLLIELILLEGFSLSGRVTASSAGNNKFHCVSDETKQYKLWACFDEKLDITLKEFAELGFSKENDDIVVFLDSSLTDTVKSRLSDLCRLKVI